MTLTEVLVVLAIVGILASVLMPAVKSVKIRAATAACQAEIRDFERACRNFHEDFGFYPPDTFGTSYNTYVNSRGQRVINWLLTPLLKGCPARSDLLRTPDDITGPENTSIMGSEFTIGGISYGPYQEFRKEQLDPHPDDPNWHGERYPATGLATGGGRQYGAYGRRATGRAKVPWSIKGVDDDNPGTDVRLFRYLDKFGPPRRGNWRYFDYYVYDCHFPEGWRMYGPEPQPPDHNAGFVDISCYGFDGNTSINVAEDSGGTAEDPGGDEAAQADDDVDGARGKELRGMWKDDINNWTSSNVWPTKRY
jgi:prepilin-type N-terminal cleavage/methylation domain-containing protein